MSDDYVFRYPVEEPKEGGRDALLEMVRAQLESLLGLVALYREGEEVKADSFRLLNEREAVHPIFQSQRPNSPSTGLPGTNPTPPQPSPARGDGDHPFLQRGNSPIETCQENFQHRPAPLTSNSAPGVPSPQSVRTASLYEPRIPHIKTILETILSVVDLEEDGRPVKISGFRLKHLGDWLVPSAGDPGEIIDQMATNCDCSCRFCYLRGNPDALALEQCGRPAAEEYAEAQTRLNYFSPERKQALFPTLGSPYEALAHPHILEVLAELRKKTVRPFRFSTNGNSLTADFIARLAELRPVYLYISLNSSSAQRRRWLMGGAARETAIRALPLLKQQAIPYAAVIVPWPFPSVEEMLADFRETVFYADRHDAHLIEVSLPGWSRDFRPDPGFEREEVWSVLVREIHSLRPQIQTPLLVKPSLFEENQFEKRKNLPRVKGLVKNSPMARSGLRIGDLVLSIAGIKVSSRPQARDLLHLQHGSRSSAFSLEVQREGTTARLEARTDSSAYPYSPETDHHLGAIFCGSGLRSGLLEALKTIASARGARRVLFFSSPLVKPTFEQLLGESPLFGGIEMHIEVPANRFFGGNICMGDLLVVQDFIDAAREYLQHHPAPDLIVIPSTPFSLGDWRRDLEGRDYREIERAVGVPLALLDCEPIYD